MRISRTGLVLAALAVTFLAACSDPAPATPSPVPSTPVPAATASPSPTPLVEEPGYDQVQTMYALSDAAIPSSSSVGPGPHVRLQQALASARRNRDLSQVPVLIELLPFAIDKLVSNEIAATLRELTGEVFGGARADWIEWEEWLGKNLVDYLPPDGYIEWKVGIYSKIDPDIGALLSTADNTLRVDFTGVFWAGLRMADIVDMRSPASVPMIEAVYLKPDDRVIGVSINGEHRAYPLRILVRHENANDTLGGEPIVVSYCALCLSGSAYSAEVDREPTTFGSAALIYRSTNLIFDRATRTVWSQITGEPVIGPLAGSDTVLRRYPSVLTTWAEWLSEHPDTTVLSIETGIDSQATYLPDSQPGAPYREYAASSGLLFPVWNQSPALPLKELITGVAIDDQIGAGYKAYPHAIMQRKRIVNDIIGQTDYVVIASATTDSVKVYERRGRFFSMTSTVASSGGFPTELIDRTTGARWRITEDAIVNMDDPGQALDRIPAVTAYWFAWQTFHPDTRVYKFEEGG